MRYRQLASLLAALLAVGTGCLAEERPWMAEGAIRSDLINRKLAGVYPSGLPWSEDIHGDGTTDYEEAGVRTKGRWTLAGAVFCFKYDAPLAGGCFRMIKLGSNCYELYVERDFGAPVPDPGNGVAWNGRMWRTTEPATCDEKPSV